MTRRLLVSIPVLTILAAGAGCRSHSIREGRWEMTLNAQDLTSKQAVDLPEYTTYDVRVRLDWADDGNELVEIEKLGTEISLRRMYGDIIHRDDGSPPAVSIKSQSDALWVFTLQGVVVDETEIKGTAFVARHRQDRDTVLNGRWEMVWTSED